MSGISKFKRIYSEGVAAEHPDVEGQKEFANKADEILAIRKRKREQSGKNAKLDAIGRKLYNMNKIGEETELGEAHWDPATKTISDKKRTGTDPEIQKMAAKAAASGPKKRKPLGSVRKNSADFKPSSPEQAKSDMKSWDRYWEGSWKNKKMNEKIDVGADAGATISDFVHSKSKTFKGDSKKQRIKRALGAYYGAQKEEKKFDEGYMPPTQKRADKMMKQSSKLHSTGSERGDFGNPEAEKKHTQASKIAFMSRRMSDKAKERDNEARKKEFKEQLQLQLRAQKEETENIYDYVIEALVDADFAQDYETAENMFECMSDEFVAVILEEYIEEAKRPKSQKRTANAGKKGYDAKGNPIPKVSTTHVIHDVDDNLADQRSKDAAKIDVMRNNNKTKSLTPGEFARHKLEPGDKYGFDEFRSSKKFKDTTKPIKPVARIGDSKKRSAKKSVVTARGGSAFGINKPSTPMDESFAKDLRDRIGVRGIEKPNIHFTGGMSKGSNKGLSGPEKKAKVVAQIVNPDTKKVITTDDHLGNTRAMAAAASAAAPQSKVIAYQSRPATRKPKGKGKVGDIVPSRVGKENKPEDTNIGIRSKPDAPKSTRETQRARKKARKNMGEELSSYEYWKQFVD